MKTIYTTTTGVQLEIGSIPRRFIDQLIIDHPMPNPPTRTEDIWGGLTEEVPDWENPDYHLQLNIWYAKLGNEQTAVILPAIHILDNTAVDLSELAQLREAGILPEGGEHDTLLYGVLADQGDITAVTELVFYHSTVTQRGISEAENAYGVTWFDKPVLAWKVPEVPAKHTNLYRDRQAATQGGYTWDQFSELPGPEQSAIVAYQLIHGRLEWFMSRFKTRKL